MTEQQQHDESHLRSMIESYLGTRDSKSPPKAQVDEASLQQAMDKNKESLKVKLMMRRPINQLVEQGIIPSPKKPVQYLQQCRNLERAKTERVLKNLIKTRPNRQALIDHHILEDTTIDPSLQDKQRQLKKARLADDLNDRLSHRPGPLELVKGNILHADEEFAQAIKEGQIPFKRTCEGQALRHPMPSFIFEEDSGSDVALSPPQDLLDQSLGSMPSVESMVLSPYPSQDSPSSSMGELRIASGTPPTTQPAPSLHTTVPPNEAAPRESTTPIRRKKSKPKVQQPKTRTIKFHEYKGPPSAQKPLASLSNEETSYELLLQQQQLFLQWQLEMQQKYPQVILPGPPPPPDQSKSVNPGQGTVLDKSQTSRKVQDVSVSSPQNAVKSFEELKLNGLKAECKKRSLPVSGSKLQLLERLRNHMDSSPNGTVFIPDTSCTVEAAVPINVSGILLDSMPTLVHEPVTSVVTVEAPRATLGEDARLMVYNAMPVQHGQIVAPRRPPSAIPMDVEGDGMDCSDGASASREEIVRMQQKKILQLERELERSQRQLQQQQWLQHQQQQAQQQVLLAAHPVPIAPAPQNMATALPQTLVQPQLLQAKSPLSAPQQLLQQATKFPPGSAGQQSALVKASLAAFIHNQQANNVRMRNGLQVAPQNHIPQFTNLKPIVLCQTQAVSHLVEKPRANSLPNGLGQHKMVWSSSVPNFSNVIAPKIAVNTLDPKYFVRAAPPEYVEVAKVQNKIKQEKPSGSKRSNRKSVKNQEVEDVLDVLISHGELPPSAAVTPSTPETQKGCMAPPAFPIALTQTNPISTQEILPQDPDPMLVSTPKSQPPQREVKNEPNPGIEFDLNLDLQDLDTMDLGVLDRNVDVPASRADPPQQVSSSPSGDLDMDVDLGDWLDILTNNNQVSNANQSRTCGYSGDPLLPGLEGNQDALDMFSLDNLDFKLPSDSNLLWDKIDYAT